MKEQYEKRVGGLEKEPKKILEMKNTAIEIRKSSVCSLINRLGNRHMEWSMTWSNIC